jgi:hypothetical protein
MNTITPTDTYQTGLVYDEQGEQGIRWSLKLTAYLQQYKLLFQGQHDHNACWNMIT